MLHSLPRPSTPTESLFREREHAPSSDACYYEMRFLYLTADTGEGSTAFLGKVVDAR
jgi:hypothetical protein